MVSPLEHWTTVVLMHEDLIFVTTSCNVVCCAARSATMTKLASQTQSRRNGSPARRAGSDDVWLYLLFEEEVPVRRNSVNRMDQNYRVAK